MLDLNNCKNKAANTCSFDYAQALGGNLKEKVQNLYVVCRRMQYIARGEDGSLPNTLILCPLVLALLEITFELEEGEKITLRNRPDLIHQGKVFGKWHVFLNQEDYQEHHVLMTSLDSDGLPEDPTRYVRISILNLVMSNPFGYFNLK